jgi:prepilin-type N-terminal cleavage/methylation domain-containing protein
MRNNIHSEKGFTVVEMMIATMVFSVILTAITMGVISFSNRYYRGVTSSITQTTAQDVLDTITQAIQLGGGSIDLTTGATAVDPFFCAGGYSFTYDDSGVLYSGSQRGIYVAPQASSTCASATTGGKQLLAKNMRIANLSISGSNGVYDVNVTIANGEDDLLCAPSVSGSCAVSASPMPSYWKPDLKCKPSVGMQFCAVNRLTTSVQKRVN